MRNRLAGLVAGTLILSALVPGLAHAGAPATVTVRVAGLQHTLTSTTVTTTAAPITIDGHSCSGTSDGGALTQAVGQANWGAHWDGSQNAFSLDSIYGEALSFVTDHAFWSPYVNGLPTSAGICGNELSNGDDVVFVAACANLPAAPPCWDDPLAIQSSPTAITAGVPFTVHVLESVTDPNTFDTTVGPSTGATVTAGSASATTDASGNATLTVTATGPITITATKGDHVPDTRSVTSSAAAAAPAPVPAAPIVIAPDTTPPASVLAGLTEGKRYAAGQGPRQLSGSVSDASGVLMVKLRITRTAGGHCSYFSGRTLTFRGMHCGAENGSWFKIDAAADWKYLLPARLAAGRYVVDVNAIDKDYNRDDTRRRGSNRVVFTVS